MEQNDIDRFHTKYVIDAATNCWNWTGYLDQKGYGRFWINKKPYMAHRASAMIHGLDMSGEVMRHMCNNPRCVNPEHLQTGSHQDNYDDMIRAGRRGKTGNPTATDQLVILLREKYSTGNYSQKQLAVEYNLGEETVRKIVKRITWKHI